MFLDQKRNGRPLFLARDITGGEAGTGADAGVRACPVSLLHAVKW